MKKERKEETRMGNMN